jgi:hypothetical protein
MRKIKLIEDIPAYMTVIEKDSILEEDEPYQGFNEDGTFTICQGMDIYIVLEKNKFVEL